MEDTGTLQLEKATRMLAEARHLREVKEVLDVSAAAAIWAKRSKLGIEAQNYAAEIKLRAERKAGELLATLERGKGGGDQYHASNGGRVVSPYASALEEAGATRQDANRWEKVATVPEDRFEQEIASTKSRGGELTTSRILKVEKEVRREERLAERSQVEKSFPRAPRSVAIEPGRWYELGDHLLYCGDTSSKEFRSGLECVPLSFADPPYGVGADHWDSELVWNHDFLGDLSKVVAVTPGIEKWQEFFRLTNMHYRWTVGCWIKNGMARGALGFGNWIGALLFSVDGFKAKQSQDYVEVVIEPGDAEGHHRGRKPKGLLWFLLDVLTDKGETVIDPFLGYGTTLLVAEAMGRRCVGGELSAEYCADIVRRWEGQTGRAAKECSE